MKRLFSLLPALSLSLALGACGGGVGSGGTGSSAGIGSGGTGIVAAAVAIGPVEGFGSVIVNGIRYDTGSATIRLSDAGELKLGMTVRVTGTVNLDLSVGTATQVTATPELRGNAGNIDVAGRSLRVGSVPATTDGATVFEGVAGLAGLAEGDAVQVYGLAGASGPVRATRIEKLATSAEPIVTGAIQDLDGTLKSFSIGSIRVGFADAAVDTGGQPPLAEGLIVTVRGSWRANGLLAASSVEAWRGMAPAEGSPVSLGGLITDFSGASSFRVQGVAVNASDAKVTGGSVGSLGNGVRVEVAGPVRGGVLQAGSLKIRHAPGSDGPVSTR